MVPSIPTAISWHGCDNFAWFSYFLSDPVQSISIQQPERNFLCSDGVHLRVPPKVKHRCYSTIVREALPHGSHTPLSSLIQVFYLSFTTSHTCCLYFSFPNTTQLLFYCLLSICPCHSHFPEPVPTPLTILHIAALSHPSGLSVESPPGRTPLTSLTEVSPGSGYLQIHSDTLHHGHGDGRG